MQEESAVRAGEVEVNHEAVAPYGEGTAAMGVAEWMWEWRDSRVVWQGEPPPGGLEYEMDFATGINCARLPFASGHGSFAQGGGRRGYRRAAPGAFPLATGVTGGAGGCEGH